MPKVKSLNPTAEALSKLFRHALLDKAWTQEHLAELCAMDASSVSRIINSPEKRQMGNIIIVAKKLGIKEIPIL